jgi:alpha-tubulin suppressor-like RCC1 family protein
LSNKIDLSEKEYFTDIACGMYHSIGLKEDGNIIIWGNNIFGQRNNLPAGIKFLH